MCVRDTEIGMYEISLFTACRQMVYAGYAHSTSRKM